METPAEYLDKYICPICNKHVTRSDYLAGVFKTEPKLEWIANLITHYRHDHISSWNRMWGHHGKSYQRAANFGDYEQEKVKVNNRAKRQLIRLCYPVFIELEITAQMFSMLENNDLFTLRIANQFLNGKVDITEPKKEPVMELPALKDNDIMEYGQHQGIALVNIPAQYWIWLWDEKKLEKRPRYKKYVSDNIDVLRKQAKK